MLTCCLSFLTFLFPLDQCTTSQLPLLFHPLLSRLYHLPSVLLIALETQDQCPGLVQESPLFPLNRRDSRPNVDLLLPTVQIHSNLPDFVHVLSSALIPFPLLFTWKSLLALWNRLSLCNILFPGGFPQSGFL